MTEFVLTEDKLFIVIQPVKVTGIDKSIRTSQRVSITKLPTQTRHSLKNRYEAAIKPIFQHAEDRWYWTVNTTKWVQDVVLGLAILRMAIITMSA